MGGKARGGNDTLSGCAAGDRITGDTLIVVGKAAAAPIASRAAVVRTCAATPRAWATMGVAATTMLHGEDGNDNISGEGPVILEGAVTCGDDRLSGGAGADELFGDALVILGGATVCGDNRLEGGFGDDEL